MVEFDSSLGMGCCYFNDSAKPDKIGFESNPGLGQNPSRFIFAATNTSFPILLSDLGKFFFSA